MQDGNAKQLVAEKIKSATNILVTVSSNPSVDELSAALGLTLLLNKMDKHATAVFSGTIPPAITFLEPDKTFESTTDSLRDFIIALDKDKADRLRYKVEDDVVRIFITPYRTTITADDLDFSQGDFNVELIIALGVEKQDDLDKAIIAHGRILHDATVVTLNTGDKTSSLGAVDWQDKTASSLSEMLVSVSESLGSGMLDQQIANALLTGIVAATERFRNNRTSPKVMTMAAQLMAAGANQQLIATKLEEGRALKPANVDGSTELKEGASSKVEKSEASARPNGEMLIEHTPSEQAADKADKLADEAEERLSKQLETAGPQPATSTETIKQALEKDTAAAKKPASSWRGREIQPPTMGSPLSATSEEALSDKLEAEDKDKNRTILTHDVHTLDSDSSLLPPAPSGDEDERPAGEAASYIVGQKLPPVVSPAPETPTPPEPEPKAEASAPKSPPVEPKPEPTTPLSSSEPVLNYEPTPEHPPEKTLIDLEREAHAHAQAAAETAAPAAATKTVVDQARATIGDAVNDPDHPSAIQGLTSASDNPNPAVPQPAPSPDFTLPMPDMNTLPPLPPTFEQSAQPPSVAQPSPVVPPPADKQPPAASNDPGQFKIPGQP